ncbi:lysozyme [Burkholderia cenocepacia]|uniref:lysozyme n=1 Tax=Burkholderia cenocepacia TaxID=95486 RepID=UPI001B91A743|nr:lysozyme [Burkholderia cenocepacia]MBR8350263.1 lysozyme [Burkholderia cenocepacia]
MGLSDLFRAIFSLFGRAAAATQSPTAVPSSTPTVPVSAPSGTKTAPDVPQNVPVAPDAAPAPAVAPVVPVPVAHEPDWLVLCRPLTEASESCRLTAYPDPASGGAPWTIGWGATGAGIVEGTVWTRDHADSRLTIDLNARADIVDRLVKVILTPAKKAALVDFVYNVGEGNFESSTLLKRLNAGDYQAAADEFPKWNLAHGKVMPGLVRRRARERDLFLTGKWSAA